MSYRNPLLARLAAGEASIGSWVSTPDPVIAEIIASCGFDHVIADLQHGSLDLGNLGTSGKAKRRVATSTPGSGS